MDWAIAPSVSSWSGLGTSGQLSHGSLKTIPVRIVECSTASPRQACIVFGAGISIVAGDAIHGLGVIHTTRGRVATVCGAHVAIITINWTAAARTATARLTSRASVVIIARRAIHRRPPKRRSLPKNRTYPGCIRCRHCTREDFPHSFPPSTHRPSCKHRCHCTWCRRRQARFRTQPPKEQLSSVHGLSSSQTIAVPPHVPDWHISSPVHRFSSSHVVPFNGTGSNTQPTTLSQLSSVQGLLSSQVTGVVSQEPALHIAVTQASLLHDSPIHGCRVVDTPQCGVA